MLATMAYHAPDSGALHVRPLCSIIGGDREGKMDMDDCLGALSDGARVQGVEASGDRYRMVRGVRYDG